MKTFNGVKLTSCIKVKTLSLYSELLSYYSNIICFPILMLCFRLGLSVLEWAGEIFYIQPEPVNRSS